MTFSGGACAYYAAHVLAGAADIVICPHNYVLDPVVSRCGTHHRRNWSLKSRMIILDEAHNVEDLCRDVGSFDLQREEIVAIIDMLTQLGNEEKNP
ncbi:unnamed protein product, partial [Amoebophrya sp. A25]|eukprot:GSA25T00017284001.1